MLVCHPVILILKLIWFIFAEWIVVIASLFREIFNGCVSIGFGWSLASNWCIDNNPNTEDIHNICNNDARSLDDCASIFGLWPYMVGGNLYHATLFERSCDCGLFGQRIRHCTEFLWHHFWSRKHIIVYWWIRFNVHGWYIDSKQREYPLAIIIETLEHCSIHYENVISFLID